MTFRSSVNPLWEELKLSLNLKESYRINNKIKENEHFPSKNHKTHRETKHHKQKQQEPQTAETELQSLGI